MKKKADAKNLNPHAFGLWRHCEWNTEINFDDVPGNVVARFLGTMCRVLSTEKNSFYQYCNYLYNNKEDELPEEEKEKIDFWNLTHYDDLEDLVGLFLQKECDYFIFPSTNKQGTKDYEYKLVHKDSKKEAIIQCKHTEDIDIIIFENYKEETFLLIVNGKVNLGKDRKQIIEEDWKIWKTKEGEEKIAIKKYYYENKNGKKFEYFKFDKDVLKEWAKENSIIMPQRIKNFLKISRIKICGWYSVL